MNAFSLITTILFFIVLPYVLGQVWNETVGESSFTFRYFSGFFSVLAIFELLSPAMILLHIATHVQFIVYNLVFLAVFIVVLIVKGKTIPGTMKKALQIPKLKITEIIYIAVFLALLGVQVYYALFYDIGDWRSDDYMYVTFSNAAIYDDGFFKTTPVFGSYIGWNSYYVKYALCGIYGFYTYASMLMGISVAAIEHSLCCVLFLVMAYGSFYLLSKYLFSEEKERENRFIFLIFLEFLYLFGMYSHYSLSFRLFGVIWQGKGFLAVVLVPFLLAIYPRFLGRDLTKKDMAYLMMLSLATVSPTMGGLLAIVLIPGIITGLHFLSNRDFKVIKNAVAVWIFPVLEIIVFLIGRR